MKRFLRIGIVFTAAAVVLFAAFHFTRAQGKASGQGTQPPPLKLPSPLPPDPHVPSHYLVKSLFTEDYGIDQYFKSTLEGYGFESGPVYFNCWAPCTLEININADMGKGDVADNWMWLGYELDNEFSGWTAVADILENGSWVQGTWDWTVCLKPGQHWVWAGFTTSDGAYLWSYHNNYRIYMP